MKSTQRNARIAGLLYLIIVICGIISLMYVPSKLIVRENAIETYNNIVTNESLFKIGILCDLIMYTTFIFLSLALYKLLKQINKNVAITMVVLILVSVPISYVNLISKLDILSLINGTNSLQPIELNEQYLKVMTLLKSYSNGILIVQIFWGLWLFPFGYLVFKSGFLPKFFGILLMVGCFGYITDFLGYFFFPEDYGKTLISTIASLPHALGEIGICLWLLIIGVKKTANNELR